jgi:hypothetical protein
MASDTIVFLEELRCTREKDGSGHSEPFIWPVLVLIDDSVNVTGHVHLTAPAVEHARVVIKNDMRRGQTAPIPSVVNNLRLRTDSTQTLFSLILIVALLENDETPSKAARAGFSAFVNGLRQGFDDRIGLLVFANTPEDRDPLVEDITNEVHAKVESAVRGALTGGQKVRVKLGTLNLDDFIDSDVQIFDKLQSKSFSLSFSSGETPVPENRYTISGQFIVRRVIVDRCASLVKRVADAQTAVNDVLNEIKDLQDKLTGGGSEGEPSLPKSFLTEEIARIREEELPDAEQALDDAQAALHACRSAQPTFQLNPAAVLSSRG